jgi:hypothetical protein
MVYKFFWGEQADFLSESFLVLLSVPFGFVLQVIALCFGILRQSAHRRKDLAIDSTQRHADLLMIERSSINIKDNTMTVL